MLYAFLLCSVWGAGGRDPQVFWECFAPEPAVALHVRTPMAQTEHLPIYKSTYDLCVYLEQVVQNFSRYHKHALGADLRDGARRALKLVVRTNAQRDKTPVLL